MTQDYENHYYGTWYNLNEESVSDDMPDIERTAPQRAREKGIAMRPLADQASETTSLLSSEDGDSDGSAQDGVKRLEAISSTWSRTGLFVAYLGIASLAFATSLESQTTTNLTIFATSAFSSHSLVSTVGVVQGVVLSVAKPPMSKIADVFGRLEAFTLSVFLFVIGYIQQAASDSVKTYAAAQIFYAAGSTGLQILIQIFVADTSDLLNRVLVSSIADVPFLLTVWIGPIVAQYVLDNATWRWGYGIWAVVLPVAFAPLACALAINQRRAAKRGLLPKSQYDGLDAWRTAQTIWYELDAFGLVLICGAFSLILIPLTLAAKSGWGEGNTISMLVVGTICLVAFPFWERSNRFAPRPFIPRELFRSRTVVAGVVLAFFYFMAFYLSVLPYFQSYLIVVKGESVSSAGRIVQIFSFTSTISQLVVSQLIKYTRRYKYFVTLGSLIYAVAIYCMIVFRTEESSRATIIATQIFIGIGGGLTHGPAQLGVQASGRHREVSAATAIFLTVLEIGGAVGNAISGAIWSNSMPQKLSQYLPTESRSQADAIFGNVTLAANGWPMGSPTRIAINRAYQETMTKILTVGVCIAIPCIILSFFMENYKLDEIDQGVKGTVVGGTQEGTERRDSLSVPGPSGRASWSSDEDDPVSDSGRNGQTTALFKRVRRRS